MGKKRKASIRPGTIEVLEPSGKCSRWITAKPRKKSDANFMSWGQVSVEQKNSYFDEFRKGFEWEASEEKAIHAAWNKKASKLYANMTCRARKNENRPDFILDDVWENWKEKWEDSTFKTRSTKMKANRGRASTHTGGSRSFSNHADVLEAYQREMASSADNGTPLNETEAFFKAAGERKKGGVYGVGDTMNIYYGSSSGSSMQSEGASWRSLMGEMEQLRQALQVERAEREKIQTHMAQWQLVFQKMGTTMENSSGCDGFEGNELAHNASE